MGGMSGGGGGGGMTSLFSSIGASVGALGTYFVTRRANREARDDMLRGQDAANALYDSQFGEVRDSYRPTMEGGASAYEALLRSYGLGSSGFAESSDYADARRAWETGQTPAPGTASEGDGRPDAVPGYVGAGTPYALVTNAYNRFRGDSGSDPNPSQPRGAFEDSDQYRAAMSRWQANNPQQPSYSGFYDSPDYQFALTQGQNALDRSAASRGRLYSGAQVRGSLEYGQGLGTQYLGNYRTGLGNLAGMGMDATNALNAWRGNYTQLRGQGYTNIGDINAAERLGQAAAHQRWSQQTADAWGVGGSGGGQQGGNALGGGQASSYNWGGMGSPQSAGGWSGGGNNSFTGGQNYSFSDRRLKSDIRAVGALDNGLRVYAYKINGVTQIGLMADEVAAIHPDAVAEHQSGFLMVDYAKGVR